MMGPPSEEPNRFHRPRQRKAAWMLCTLLSLGAAFYFGIMPLPTFSVVTEVRSRAADPMNANSTSFTKSLPTVSVVMEVRTQATDEMRANLTNFTKIIWMFWDQGLDHLESLRNEKGNKYAGDASCVKAMILLHPDWTVNVLSRKTARKLAPLYSQLIDSDTKGIVNVVHYGDLLRLELLYNYGGVWADTSVCPFDSFTNMVPRWLEGNTSGFYATPVSSSANRTGDDLQQVAKKCHIKCANTSSCNSAYSRSCSNFFLVAAQPGHHVYKLWMERYYENTMDYIRRKDRKYPYYLAQCSFTQVRARHPTVESVWKPLLDFDSKNQVGRSGCFGGPSSTLSRGDQDAIDLAKKNCFYVKKQNGKLGEYVRSSDYFNYISSLRAPA